MSSTIQSSPVVNPSSTIPSSQLKSAIDRVLICTTKEPSRFRLNAIKFESDGSYLKMISTDGHRASVATIPVELPEFQMLVPAADFTAIKKLCRRKKDVITVHSTADSLTFESPKGEKVVVHPVGEIGEFPPIDHVLETQTTGTIPVLDPLEFRRGIRMGQIARLCGERNFKTDGFGNLVKIISTPRKMTVYGKAKNNGTRSVCHMDSNSRSTGVSVAVNANYVLDLLKVMPKDEPIEMGYWKNGTEGVTVRTNNFHHVLCGITEKRGMSH
ncbi:MAG: hypothetical protein KC931_19195 [Candidatus Omnitrophica bacterium]|nr:hypothetical protein [Candidatus Omnitrophota bacterium]